MKKKLSNFWYYYKWYVLFALLVLVVVGDFLSQRQEIVEPDAAVSFVTMQYIPAQVQTSVQNLLADMVGDTNGDGKQEIAVNVYAFDGKGSDGTNTEIYAAAVVHLASEIKLQTTSFFVTDEPQVLEEAGTLVQRGTWADYPALMALENELLPEFRIYVFQDETDSLLEQLK